LPKEIRFNKKVGALRNTKNKLLAFLTMGITPERLAFSIALGIALGLVPALGTTTLLCTLAAFLFRLNLTAILLMNYFVYPLQLALLIPFIRAGEWLFGAKHLDLSLELIQNMLKADLWKTVFGLWAATMRAVTVWLLIAPLVVLLIYLLLTPFLRRLKPARLTPAA
jgi:uncharacterized protein (DUF2062 family)